MMILIIIFLILLSYYRHEKKVTRLINSGKNFEADYKVFGVFWSHLKTDEQKKKKLPKNGNNHKKNV